jgi:hypothetical protein
MSNKPSVTIVAIDIGKNSFHLVGLDRRGAIGSGRSGLGADRSAARPDADGCSYGGLCRCTSPELRPLYLAGVSPW